MKSSQIFFIKRIYNIRDINKCFNLFISAQFLYSQIVRITTFLIMQSVKQNTHYVDQWLPTKVNSKYWKSQSFHSPNR